MIPLHPPPVLLNEEVHEEFPWPSLLRFAAIITATLFAVAFFVMTAITVSEAARGSQLSPWLFPAGASIGATAIGSVWLLDRRSHPRAASTVAVGVFLLSVAAGSPLFGGIEPAVFVGPRVMPPWAYMGGLVLLAMEGTIPWGLWTKRPWAWWIMAMWPWTNPLLPLPAALANVFSGGRFPEVFLSLCILPSAILFASLALVSRDFSPRAAKPTTPPHGS